MNGSELASPVREIRPDRPGSGIAKADPAGAASKADPLDRLFYPRSIAVVGAVGQPGSVPYDIFANLLTSGYRGTLFPVAPGKTNVCAVKAYRYVTDIPDPVDLAVIVYPANVVERAMQQCAERHIPAVVIISAGFREAGPDGIERERVVREICREHGIALVGPNCLGVINTDPAVRLNASFARRMPEQGRIAFISQSGALCTAVLDYAHDKGIGFSKFVSFGNRAGVTEMDLLRYLHRDPLTDVILLYLEEIADGRALRDVAREVTRGQGAKPIFAIKAGRTAEGAVAAASHTGSLASEDRLCDELLADAGIVRVDSIDQLFNAAVLYCSAPLPAGDRLAIVTNGGGPGVMATDAAIRAGLRVPRLSSQTVDKFRDALPATANLNNPIDVIGDARADRYAIALAAVLDDPAIDQVLVILTPQSMTDIESIARCVIESRHAHPGKLMACSFMGASDVTGGIRALQREGIAHYILPEWACRAMADLQRVRCHRGAGEAERDEAPPPPDHAAAAAIINAAPAGYLREDAAMAVLLAYGLPVPPFEVARTRDQAVAAAERLGMPVVLKVISRQITHKSEVHGVRLDLACPRSVSEGYETMLADVAAAAPDAIIDGVFVRPMIRAGHEVIIGARRDPSFGPVVMFGLGGTWVELLRDVAFASAPLSEPGAASLIARTHAGTLLAGLRGAPACDLAAVARGVVALSRLIADFERIAELDVNPLICTPGPGGTVAVADARIRLT